MQSPALFVRQTVAELRRVTWPTRAEVVNYTLIIILAVVIAGVIIGNIDYVFSRLISLIAGITPQGG